MAKKSTIDLLPAAVRAQLQFNRTSHPEWTIDDHLSSLCESHGISRSALHRWLQNNPIPSISPTDSVHTKTVALEAAILIYRGDSADDLLSLAESFLAWINSPQ